LKTIDRHILREWLSFLLIVVMATLGMLFVQCMLQDFSDLRNKGADVADMAVYFAVKIPSFMAFVLPIIVLVSLLYVLGRLHRGNEITAMRAAGLGYAQITRSIWVAGVLLCGVMWWLNASIVPWSVEKSTAMLQELGFRNEEKATRDAGSIGVTRAVTFDNDREGRIWFMNRYSSYAQRGYGVTVAEFTVRRQEKVRIHAQEAQLDGRRGCWVFYNGRETLFDPETGAVTGSMPFAEKVVSYYKEEPGLMLSFDVKPQDLSFFRLKQIMDYFEVLESPKLKIYAMRYYGILAETFAPLIVILIAIPFAITGVRVNPAVGVSKSLGLFAVYFAMEKVAQSMGTQGLVAPVVAACLPGAALFCIGGWFYARMR
jgi:lipopolysaccharide export system permease protein